MRGLLLVVSGPSGAGKTTVLSSLLAERDDLFFSISCTTRPPREEEKDGRDYHFLERERFLEKLEKGMFIEWAEYAGNLYGTPAEPIEEAVKAGKVAILDIEVKGALQIKEKYPEAVLCYIWPGSFEKLEERLRGRGTDSGDIIERRLAIAREEHSRKDSYGYVLVNDIIEDTKNKLSEIINKEKGGHSL